MKKVGNCLIGNHYPFFLSNNGNLIKNYYLYAIDSPGLSPKYYPYISLNKISERTKPNVPSGKGSDIINYLINVPGYILEKKGASFVRSLLKKDDITVEKNGKNFPLIEYKGDLKIQKMLITSLRSQLRLNSYKYSPGKLIDILWTKGEFVVFKIKGGNGQIYLEPVGVYKNTDPGMNNPLPVDFKKITYPENKFEVNTEDWKSNELESIIRKIEWNSFDRDNFLSD